MTFFGGTIIPDFSESITSGRPPTLVATTGIPHAEASTAATPKVSESKIDNIANYDIKFDSKFLEFEYKASSAFAICIFADSSEFGVCASAKENIH